MSKTEAGRMIDAGTKLFLGMLAMGFGVALLLFWWISRWPIIKAIDEKVDPRIEYIIRDYRPSISEFNKRYKNFGAEMEEERLQRDAHWEKNRYRGPK